MDALRWKQVQTLFDDAVLLPVHERPDFLQRACDGDEDLRQTLEQLIANDGESSSFSEQFASAAGTLLAELEDTAELLPEDLGLYRFVRRIGQGGMGVVYQAQHRETNQTVAIKVLRTGDFSPAGRHRFAIEQRALARLNHPLIASLYSSETFRDGTPCFVMEYVEGKPLTLYCREHGYTLRQRLALFRQVCEAVRHAHDQGVIHRDLKPSNILVKSDGTIRLLDFGVAKQLDERGDPVDITGTLRTPMTIAYAAPEQMTGDPIAPHTDVYALGIILYELLTDRPPLELNGLTPGEMEEAVRFHNPEPPSRLLRHSGGTTGSDRKERLGATDWNDLDLLCQTAIHKDARRRYQSIEALMRDLDHWMLNEPLEAHRESSTYRLTKFLRRNWRLVSASAALVIALATAGIWFTIRLARARDEALSQQARTQRVERFVLTLFDGGDPAAGPSKGATALTMLDRGAKEAETFKGDPAFESELYVVLGGLYQKLGRFDKANGLLESALANARAAPGSGNDTEAEALLALGLLRADQSRLADAERLVRQGIALEQKDSHTSKQALARAEAQLGEVLSRRREPAAALPYLNDALSLQMQASGTDSDRAATLESLAGIYQQEGNYAQAISLSQRALAMDRRTYGELHPRVADDYATLASVHLLQLDYQDAEGEYRHALQVDRSWYGDENPETIQALLTLGQTLLSEHKYQEARQVLTEGMTLARHVLGEKSQLVLFALNALGTLEQQAGNFPAAEGYFKQMVDDARSIYGDDVDVVGIAMANLGTLYEKEGKHQEASDLFVKALQLLHRLLPPNHPTFGNLEFNLGKALFGEQQYAEARTHVETSLALLNSQPHPPARIVEQAENLLLQIKRSAQAKP